MKLSALTNVELDSILTAFDAMYQAYEILEAAQVLTPDEEIDVADLSDAIVEELTRRAYEDAGYKVNQMVGRGELDRYVRPDGQIGYAPPGAWDELGA